MYGRHVFLLSPHIYNKIDINKQKLYQKEYYLEKKENITLEKYINSYVKNIIINDIN